MSHYIHTSPHRSRSILGLDYEPLSRLVAYLQQLEAASLAQQSAHKIRLNAPGAGRLANCCGISNPKRLYDRRQEISGVSIQFLTQTVAELFSLENHLKQGAFPSVILPVLVKIAVRQ